MGTIHIYRDIHVHRFFPTDNCFLSRVEPMKWDLWFLLDPDTEDGPGVHLSPTSGEKWNGSAYRDKKRFGWRAGGRGEEREKGRDPDPYVSLDSLWWWPKRISKAEMPTTWHGHSWPRFRDTPPLSSPSLFPNLPSTSPSRRGPRRAAFSLSFLS